MLDAPGLHGLAAPRTDGSSATPPVHVLMGMPGATFGVAELAAAGVKRISVGSAFSRLALGAVIRAAREIADRGTFTFSEDAIEFGKLEDIFKGFARAKT